MQKRRRQFSRDAIIRLVKGEKIETGSSKNVLEFIQEETRLSNDVLHITGSSLSNSKENYI